MNEEILKLIEEVSPATDKTYTVIATLETFYNMGMPKDVAEKDGKIFWLGFECLILPSSADQTLNNILIESDDEVKFSFENGKGVMNKND